MKKFIIITTILFAFGCRTSKNTHKNVYFSATDLNKFEGEWHFVSDSTTLTLTLKKNFAGKTAGESIIGSYCIRKQSEKELDCSIENKISSGSPIDVMSGGKIDKNKNNLFFLIQDNLKNKLCKGSLVIDKNDLDRGTLILSNIEGINDTNFDTTFTIPNNIILKKGNKLQ